ncbi:MAG: ABC transporter permease [Bacillaceae bacterium]
MNYFKRAFLSIWARKSRSLLILIVFAVIGVLVLTGLSIQSAAEKSKIAARKQLGGTVTLMPDMDKLRSKMQQNNQSSDGKPTRMQTPTLSVDDADELKDSTYLKGYNYLTQASALASDFDPIKNEEETTTTQGNDDRMPGGDMGGGRMQQGDISIQGVVFSDAIQAFTDGDYTLVDGRHLTETDVNKNVVMIEKQLADANELKVGSKMKMTSVDEEHAITVEVVGIFQSNVADDERASMAAQFSNANKMYMPYTAVNALKDEDQKNTISTAVYYLEDPANLSKFLAEGKKTSIDFDTYKLDANDSQYQQMIGPIENVASFSKNVVLLVSIAGAIILLLIVTLSIKERRSEMGILLALGEKKWKLAGQFLVEIVCVAILGFGIAGIAGNVVAGKITDQLLQQEIKVTEESQASTPSFGKGPGQQGGGRFQGGMMNQATKAEPISELDVSVTAEDLFKLGGIGLLLAALAVLVPTVQVARLQPRTILSKQE